MHVGIPSMFSWWRKGFALNFYSVFSLKRHFLPECSFLSTTEFLLVLFKNKKNERTSRLQLQKEK